MKTSSIVPGNIKDTELITYLANRFTYLSEEQWRERVVQGRLFCNDAPCTVDTTINGGDRVTYDMPDFVEPPADLSYSIVYEDEYLLGINKPGNLLVHRAGRSVRSNLIYHLRYLRTPSFSDAHIVNRLDRETSGVVMVAKGNDALVDMQRLFANREVQKSYLAIVHGVPDSVCCRIDVPIGKDRSSSVTSRFCVEGHNAKSAVTDMRLLRRWGDDFSLIRLHPHTGRTHQLRVHMAHLGHVIAGDKLYGLNDLQYTRWREKPEEFASTFPIKRQALHCESLEFNHPCTNARCRITAQLPADIQQFIQTLDESCDPEDVI
ncbi:MAG: RluA family pseudouridine synthase [Chitinivibrionales bacterium]